MYNVVVNDITLYYDRLGTGEPLVLIHGLGERKEGWKYQHELANHYDLIIPDLRGFGKSTLPDNKEISITNFAKDILALLDKLNIKTAHICGLSMGGIIAQEIYKLDSSKVQSLILANSIFYVPKWLGNFIYKSRKKKIEQLTPEEHKMISTERCLYTKDRKMIEKVLPAWSDKFNSFIPAWKACLEIDYRTLLPTIDVPTLVILCKNDKICRPYNQKKMHKLIPNSQLVTIKKAGHVGKIEKPDEFNHAILHFLQSTYDQDHPTSAQFFMEIK
ncbi:alpha/beta fold hydrolase [Alkalihalobacterium chitinilyticum]|uniref:Alpha/beta hydrolase n=1 Tax=Alkalihalobacterium chitinilyticum TaxID=2980103 RepID=A0ABT5V9K0_9BACI|nr:alpha/beta hydrolase [Alkalihalobacterium chitinilyticum]MDE5411960.1 alpha/beta hydrolase [Alkalihalobacterium chitinilyticum]